MEKNKLMRFFKLVWQHLEASDGGGGDQGSEENSRSSKSSDEDLESPFVNFLNRMPLPRSHRKNHMIIILFSVLILLVFIPSFIYVPNCLV